MLSWLMKPRELYARMEGMLANIRAKVRKPVDLVVFRTVRDTSRRIAGD